LEVIQRDLGQQKFFDVDIGLEIEVN